MRLWSFFFVCFRFLWLCHAACRISVPQLCPPVVETQSLNHWTARKVWGYGFSWEHTLSCSKTAPCQQDNWGHHCQPGLFPKDLLSRGKGNPSSSLILRPASLYSPSSPSHLPGARPEPHAYNNPTPPFHRWSPEKPDDLPKSHCQWQSWDMKPFYLEPNPVCLHSSLDVTISPEGAWSEAWLRWTILVVSQMTTRWLWAQTSR